MSVNYLLDLSYVSYKNQLLINKPISKIAKILNIPTLQLLQDLQTQYPNINWDQNKSVTEILRSDLDALPILPKKPGTQPSDSVAQKTELRKRKLSELQPEQEGSSEPATQKRKLNGNKEQRYSTEKQMRVTASCVSRILYKGLIVHLSSKPSLSPMPLLTGEYLLKKLNISEERRKAVLEQLKPNRIVENLCVGSLFSAEEKLRALSILIKRDTRHLRTADPFGNRSVHLASKSLDQLTPFLLQYLHRQDFNVQNRNGLTPLHLALRSGSMQALPLLAVCDPTIANVDGISSIHIIGKYALHAQKPEDFEKYYAAIFGHLPEGFDFNSHVDKLNHTALHYAAINYNIEVIPYLIKAGTKLTCQDVYGDTPLLNAIKTYTYDPNSKLTRSQFEPFLHLLLDSETLFIKNNAGRDIFHYAAMHTNPSSDFDPFDLLCQKAREFCSGEDIIKMLVEPDQAGVTPAMYAKVLQSTSWRKIKEKLSPEQKAIMPSQAQLTCGTCQGISRDPVILTTGNAICTCCSLGVPECIIKEIDQPLRRVIQYLFKTNTSNKGAKTYSECVLSNIRYLGEKIGKPNLNFDQRGMFVLDIDGDFQIAFKNFTNPNEMHQSRLVLSVRILKDEETEASFSLETTKDILNQYHQDATFDKGGFIFHRNGLVFMIALSARDLQEESALENVAHLLVEFVRNLRACYLNPPTKSMNEKKRKASEVSSGDSHDAEPIGAAAKKRKAVAQTNSSDENANRGNAITISERTPLACEKSPKEIPGSEGAVYYTENNTLHLLVPINININNSKALINYLQMMDLVYFSFPIIKDGKLFRKMSVEILGENVDPSELQKYVTDLRKL